MGPSRSYAAIGSLQCWSKTTDMINTGPKREFRRPERDRAGISNVTGQKSKNSCRVLRSAESPARALVGHLPSMRNLTGFMRCFERFRFEACRVLPASGPGARKGLHERESGQCWIASTRPSRSRPGILIGRGCVISQTTLQREVGGTSFEPKSSRKSMVGAAGFEPTTPSPPD